MSTSANCQATRSTAAAPLRRPVRSTFLSLLSLSLAFPAFAATPLADQPLFTSTGVPGNVALALSVEYPTAIRAAHTSAYSNTGNFLGYFDPAKCYTYKSSGTAAEQYFIPAGLAGNNHTCSGQWSGNFLNWATMQTIDPFRWALTGGYRKIDTTDLTVLERAWQSGQDNGLSPDKVLPGTAVAGATPFGGANALNIRVANLGDKFRFTTGAAGTLGGTATPYQNAATAGTLFEAYVRVKVCDPSSAAGGVETNCKQYGTNWKPEGLIQQYSDRMRFSAFGYLNDTRLARDGGILRAKQKFVGPIQPVPLRPSIENPNKEWDANTGVFLLNPDSSDASDTTTIFGLSPAITNSGVMNYLNKFGQVTPGNYKAFDPVSELYYATIRYFKNQGNVPEWTDMSGADSLATRNIWADGFPVITRWDDPIQYSCQRNFVLGIGDVRTHADKNLPGNALTANEPAMPSLVQSDNTVNAVTATNKVGTIQGMGANLGTTSPYNGCCTSNAPLMAGLAYHSNTTDIRPDVASSPQTLNKQTVQTYWVDVLERGFARNNQFYLAAKYGGFSVPTDFSFANHTAALPLGLWSTTGDKVGIAGSTEQDRPDNYFTGGRPDQLVSGLTQAFVNIAANLRAFTTSFALPAPQVSNTGNASFSSRYDSSSWTGEIAGTSLALSEATGEPTSTQRWVASERLADQLTGTGWNTNRRVATWNTQTNRGVPFRFNDISTAQQTALDTSYRTGNDGSDYLDYLRGNRTHEVSSQTAGNRFYRTRTQLLGDIVGSKTLPVGPPILPLADGSNPGYSAFKAAWRTRPTVVYVGANDGMLHAFNGSVDANDAAGGTERFAYVPSALYSGPNGTPNVDGLAALGNPQFVHHYYVNATPQVYDIDLARTVGMDPEAAPNWRSVLIGGLGKGGRSYYALDVTDPASMTSETAVAGKVMWEFTDTDMGYTFGEPAVIKTRKYGWVAILPSGYNNADGRGYFFIVNPRTGALLEKIPTGVGSTTDEAGMAHVNTFVNDRSIAIADSAYAGDLLGNIWRLDLTALTGAYPAPVRLATLTDPGTGAAAQPITARPRIEISPATGVRNVLVGTGRLLATTDVASTQEQSFYAIRDGNNRIFNTDTTGFPIRRANLASNANLLTGLTDPAAASFGWYLNLGQGASDIGWRVISEAENFSGVVAFPSILPNGDACNPSGNSRVYAINYGTGKTALTNPDGTALALGEIRGLVTELKFLSVNGKSRLLSGTDAGELKSHPGVFSSPNALRRLNWREIRTVD